jgi:transcriptional regulator with GAF, ATPase, and Fis domain
VAEIENSGGRAAQQAPGRGEPSSAYGGQAPGWNELAERLGELSRTLQEEHDVDSTLGAIVSAAVDTVPGADNASISSVVNRREVRTLVATDELARSLDEAQHDTGEGPCLDSLYAHRTFRLGDLGAETPWPRFTARARELGLGSMLAVRLFVTGEDLGALNLHSTRPDAFGDESERVGLLFGAHAAVALAGAQEQEHLRTALSARDVIGQAKGILMERYKIDPQDAFRLLVSASQATNVKLRDVADHLAQTGELRTPTSSRSGPRSTGSR